MPAWISFLIDTYWEWILLAGAATAAALLGMAGYLLLSRAFVAEKAVREKVAAEPGDGRKDRADKVSRKLNKYFEKAQSERGDSLGERLHRAGFYGRKAASTFHTIKYALVVASFIVTFVAAAIWLPLPLAFLAGSLVAVAAYILPGIYLDKRAGKNLRAYRRTFPDFMDMMIVCADAGMSLDAAIGRVSRELGENAPELGLHLEVMNLEMRAGRSMREALHGLARRTGLPEARTLAVLFQQSEELGTSLISALRVYSEEMRQRRVTEAEERANALPIKMLLPLGGFVFPVILIVVLLPIMVRLSSVL